MNYENVYQTLKRQLTALVKNVAVRLPNEKPANKTSLDIDVSVTETDNNPYTEVETKHNVSIDILTSVPVSTGTERINHIASTLVAAYCPLQHRGGFWTDDRKHFVRVRSVSQKQANITDTTYQVNVRILATILTTERS